MARIQLVYPQQHNFCPYKPLSMTSTNNDFPKIWCWNCFIRLQHLRKWLRTAQKAANDMLGTHKPRINCIFCWSILTSLPILTSICVRLQWKCHLMVNHVTSDSIGQWHHPHVSNTGLTVLCYALHWIVKYSQMGVSLILRSLHKNVTKIAACYMWQFFGG